MNHVQLIGRLTRDPELRYSTGQNQTAICRFSLAINSGYGDNQRVDYPNIVVFGKRAENCEKYMKKGSRCAIEGRIQTGSYTNRDGNKVYTTEVIANEVEFLETKGGAQKQEGGAQQEEFGEEGMPAGFAASDDDIPF